ncbi:hypothetical protein CEXT_264621 [Caerostris extrusa]|uniref:Uncharacterized protein n=1 Tax=Caerostris extrusa TaxID=172846 RepID=A0AAV4U4P5_CAEEX|nr:hypothetical protein CEXT_264621 [Caerostris extrusa]
MRHIYISTSNNSSILLNPLRAQITFQEESLTVACKFFKTSSRDFASLSFTGLRFLRSQRGIQGDIAEHPPLIVMSRNNADYSHFAVTGIISRPCITRVPG